MSTKKAKRKRATAPVAVVEAAKTVAPSQPTIVLASNCNVKDAGELKQSLCHYLDDVEPVALDVGKVEWVGDSRVIRDAARLLGVDALLSLPGDAP